MNLFMSVGAMKAGTTWLYHVMRHHPQVHFSRKKELHYFAHQAGIANSLNLEHRKKIGERQIARLALKLKRSEISPREYQEGLAWYTDYITKELSDDWYLNLFEREKRHDSEQFCADFSNLSCFLDHDGWRHVRSLTQKLQVIYILRDPVARIWSHYKFHLQYSNHKQKGVPERDLHLFRKIISKRWFARNSMYCENIERLRGSLSDFELKIVYLDDLSRRPIETLNQIHNFIGIRECLYPDLDLQKKRNTSLRIDIPREFLDCIKEVFGEEITNMKSQGIFRDEWLDI